MIPVELSFPVLGATLPEDNGYLLFSAVSRVMDGHLGEGVSLSSIGGPLLGGWRLQVTRETHLRLRIAAERIGELLFLAGKELDVDGHRVGLGVPQVRALECAPTLAARLVTIKGFREPGPFLEAAGRQLEAIGVAGGATIPEIGSGPRRGRPMRRILTIKGVKIVGFALRVKGLSEAHSSLLLLNGLGGRRHMGCGIFTPVLDAKGECDGH